MDQVAQHHVAALRRREFRVDFNTIDWIVCYNNGHWKTYFRLKNVLRMQRQSRSPQHSPRNRQQHQVEAAAPFCDLNSKLQEAAEMPAQAVLHDQCTAIIFP